MKNLILLVAAGIGGWYLWKKYAPTPMTNTTGQLSSPTAPAPVPMFPGVSSLITTDNTVTSHGQLPVDAGPTTTNVIPTPYTIPVESPIDAYPTPVDGTPRISSPPVPTMPVGILPVRALPPFQSFPVGSTLRTGVPVAFSPAFGQEKLTSQRLARLIY